MPATLKKIETTESRLTAIVSEVAGYARHVVEGAWRIGAALNEARELCGDDASFGAWRRENITETLGIAPRTQRVFQAIARTYTLAALPQFLGITGLADVSALAPPQQAIALDYLEAAAVDGKRVPVSTSTTVVSMVKQGATLEELRHKLDPSKVIGVAEVAPEFRPAAAAPALAVVVDNDTQQIATDRAPVRRPAPAPCAPTTPIEDETAALAKRIKKLGNGKRREALAALLQALREQGLLVVDDATVVAELPEGGKGAIIHVGR